MRASEAEILWASEAVNSKANELARASASVPMGESVSDDSSAEFDLNESSLLDACDRKCQAKSPRKRVSSIAARDARTMQASDRKLVVVSSVDQRMFYFLGMEARHQDSHVVVIDGLRATDCRRRKRRIINKGVER